MTAAPPPFRTYRIITADERAACVALAEMNEERANACSPEQPALKKFFELNAEQLRKLADAPKQKR
jgi:hypothetical protein